MNFKYTANTLKKMEQLFEEARYRVRYEKGHFNSGHCILEDKKIVVINKFLNIESRINALYDLVPVLKLKEGELSGEMQKWYRQLTDSGKESAVQTQMNLE